MRLGGWGQACPGMPKEAFKTLISEKQWSYKVDFVHAISYLLKLQIDHAILDEHAQACPGIPKRLLKLNISKSKCKI